MLTKTKKSVLDAATTAPTGAQTLVISPPNFQSAKLKIIGVAPYVMNKMSSANRQAMMDKQMSGERSKKGQKRAPKDFDAVFRGAQHVATEAGSASRRRLCELA